MKFLLFIIALTLSLNSFGQLSHKVSLTDYIQDIQVWKNENQSMSLTFWIPTSYWGIALEGNSQIPPETISLLESTFDEYLFTCAVDADINSDGSITSKPESEIRKSISITDINGNVYYPLKDDEVSEDAQYLAETMKPMFNEMLGQVGKGMHLYFFKVQDAEGNNLIDEFQEGRFSVNHSNHIFEYNLPLVSLLAPKNCPTDNQTMKGNWKFCPFHGVELND